MQIEQTPLTVLENQTATGSYTRRISAVLLVVSVLWCVYWFVHAWRYWEDDAFIHLEFALSVAAGQGFAFDGKVVAGDTSPLWVVFLAGMHALIPDWMVAGKTLTALGALVGISGTYAFAHRLCSFLKPARFAEIFPAAMVLVTVVNPYTCYWIFSGMEPVAAAGLACFAVLAATAEKPSIRWFLLGCLLAGIGPVLRPEMVFLSALLAFPLLQQWRALRAGAGSLLAGIVLLCGPLAAWSIYSLHAFGHLLPNTDAAKRAGLGDSVVYHLLSVYSFGFPVILIGVAAGVIYLPIRPARVGRSLQSAFASTFGRSKQALSDPLPLAAWIFVLWTLIASVFYVVNHTYVQTRYILVSAPGLMVVIFAAALAASERAGKLLYGVILILSATLSLAIARPFVRNKGIDCGAGKDLAFFIHDHLPPNAPVAVFAIGEIGFYSQHQIIDTGGITQPGAIRYLNSRAGMLQWVRSQGAQYLIGAKPGHDAVLIFRRDAPCAAWSLHLGKYAESCPLELWKLPAEASATTP